MNDVMNHLFAEMERLADGTMDADALKEEVARAKALNNTARTITDIANSAVRARKVQAQATGKARPVEFFLKGDAD